MKQILLSSFLLITLNSFSQNVGIGTTTPTNTLHVIDSSGLNDPLKIEGLKQYTTERNLFITNPTTGVVKHIHVDSLANVITSGLGSDNQNIDSITLNGSTLTVHIENGNSSNVDLSSLTGSGNDDQNIDSLTLTGTILTTYIENGTFANIDLQPIIDSAINSSLGSDDQDIDSLTLTGTILTTYIEGGTSANIDLAALQDGTGTDNQNIDSITLIGTTLTTYIENGSSSNINLQPIIDSASKITCLVDNDNDTKVCVEKNPDEDKIRFDLEGVEKFVMEDNRIAFKNTLESVSIGNLAGDSNTGGYSVFIGTEAGSKTQSAWFNVFLGYQSGKNSIGGENVAIGGYTLATGNSGFGNIAIGDFSMYDNQNGSANVGIGYYALYRNTDGTENTAIGQDVMAYNTTGEGNAAFGKDALRQNISSNNNAAFGIRAGSFSLSSENTFVGAYSGYRNTNGTSNVIVGANAAFGPAYGSWGRNVIIGFEAARNISDGDSTNVMLGYQSGYTNPGSANVFIGHQSGYNETGSNKLYIENSNATSPLIYGDFTNNIVRINDSLEIGDPLINGYAFPTNDGSNNQVLTTDGSGTVSWTTPSGGSADSDWDINANGTGLEGNPGTNVANGTNSIAAGDGNTASGSESVAFGEDNTASANNSTVSGGSENVASGTRSTVGGGNRDTASGSHSTISGGQTNNASGDYSTISGGINNAAQFDYSFIGGGENNIANHNHAIVVGGNANRANGAQSVISGGGSNFTSGSYSVISGGYLDSAIGLYSSVSGSYNTARSHGEWVGGAFSTPYANAGGSPLIWNTDDRQFVVGSGSFGNTQDGLILHKDANLFIGSDWSGANGTGTRMTSGAKVVFLNRGTAPGTLAGSNKTAIWNNAGEIQVKDEANNVTTISPHNFSLIPEGASEELAWAFYSERDNKIINVDMAKMARLVENLSGKNLIYLKDKNTGEISTKDLSSEKSIDNLIRKNIELETKNKELEERLKKLEDILLSK